MLKLAKPPKIDTGRQNIPVLSVSPALSDHTELERLLPRPQWRVHRSSTVASALTLLMELKTIALVVCERCLLTGTWQILLAQTALLPEPPFFIVSSRLADDYLWAEALNLGAYDVLAKPFDSIELTRSLSFALLRSQRQRVIVSTLPIVTTAGAA